MLIPWTLGHTTSQQSNNAGRCVNMIPALDLYGGKGATKKGQPLHGVSGDIWAALGVGITYLNGVKK